MFLERYKTNRPEDFVSFYGKITGLMLISTIISGYIYFQNPSYFKLFILVFFIFNTLVMLKGRNILKVSKENVEKGKIEFRVKDVIITKSKKIGDITMIDYKPLNSINNKEKGVVAPFLLKEKTFAENEIAVLFNVKPKGALSYKEDLIPKRFIDDEINAIDYIEGE